MPSAKAAVRDVFPLAECVRGTFGMIVYTDETHTQKLGEGRAYWDEEAWVEAAELTHQESSTKNHANHYAHDPDADKETDKEFWKTWPISVYVGVAPKGVWEFVEEFNGTMQEALARAKELQEMDKRDNIAYRIWDER